MIREHRTLRRKRELGWEEEPVVDDLTKNEAKNSTEKTEK